jgi:hypothetical protein
MVNNIGMRRGLIKIETRNTERARDIVQWLKSNIGETLPHAGGNFVRGVGWSMSYQQINPMQHRVRFELDTDLVDPETVIMFALKWT